MKRLIAITCLLISNTNISINELTQFPLFVFPCLVTLHDKLYSVSPGISRKAQKYQVNIIFPSTFWKKKTIFPITKKIQNKNFLVISKYHLSSIFCLKKDGILQVGKVQNINISAISKYHLSIYLLSKKKTVFRISEKFKIRTFQ